MSPFRVPRIRGDEPFGDRFTCTPNVGFGMADGATRDYRIGWRLISVIESHPGFEVRLDATRREPAIAGFCFGGNGSGRNRRDDTPSTAPADDPGPRQPSAPQSAAMAAPIRSAAALVSRSETWA